MPTAKRGYSLVMWVVVFAVVISATVIFIAPVKRVITADVLHLTDHALWGVWVDKENPAAEVKEEGGWNHNQIGAIESGVSQSLDNEVIENKGKVKTVLNASSNSSSTYSSY